MSDGLEKRKFQRLESPLKVTVEVVSAQEAPNDRPRLHIKSRNISRAGICLETKSMEVGGVNLLSGPAFARENRLHLIIELFQGEPPLTVTGEVRWYDVLREASESVYLLGVEFIEIDDGGKDRLARFLKKHQDNRGYFHKLLR